LYKVLDVGHEADAAEIKRAYRKKTLAYHPDKNPGKKNY
jgi:molecular chaperone DnaJ